MKKIILMAVICCMLFSSISAFAAAENIIIDGKNVVIPEGMGTICEKDNRTFVPVRFLTEYLGCIISYQDVQQSVTITNPATSVSYFLIAGSNILFVLPQAGGAPVIKMDSAAYINNDEGRMYVPIRFLAQALGYDVGWDETTQTVTLTAVAE